MMIDTKDKRGNVVIKMKHVDKVFHTRTQDIEALRDVNIEIRKNEFVSIIGPSGCGKSTIIRVLCDIIQPTAGEIIVDGYVYQPNIPVPKSIVRKFGFVFQHPNLLPWLTVRQNMLFPLKVFGDRSAKWKTVVDDLLEMAGMSEYADHYPQALSGGMLQRVGVLRAMSYQPPILLMDEPYGALDNMLREQLDMETMRMVDQLNQTVIFITHNVAEAVFVSDRVYVMDTQPGRIIDEITIDLPRPRTLEVTASIQYMEYVQYLTDKIGKVELSAIK